MANRIKGLRKVMIPVMTLIIMASQLTGCAVVESKEMVKMIDAGESIVLEVANPSYNVAVQGEQQEEFEWVELDQLKTYNDGFRQGFDEVFNINIVTEKGINGKSGCLFVDETGDRNGNTTLEDALRNKVFVTKYWEDNKVRSKMAELANEVYQDLGDSDIYGITASINAYYNLMPDYVNPSSFNPTQSLTREEFYTLVFKTEEGVQDLQSDSKFNDAIGGLTDNSIFAKQVADYGFLKVDNKSLDGNSYNGSISRGEAVYMLVNKHFQDQLEKVTGKEKAFNDTKNAGDIALKVGFKQKDKETKKVIEKDRWQSYTLAFMLQNPDKGMQEELYKAMVVAKDLKLIDSEDSRWDEPLSKSEAFQLVMNTHLAKNKLYGYLSEVEYGNINIDKFYKGGIAGIDLTEVTSVDEYGYKHGDNWEEINPYQREYNLDDEVGDGLTVRDLKITVDFKKEQYEELGAPEDEIRELLELVVEDYDIPLDVLLDMPPIEDDTPEEEVTKVEKPQATQKQEKPSTKKGSTQKTEKPATKKQDKTSKPATKPAAKPATKPADKPKQQKTSSGYTKELGVPGTFPKTEGDKDGDGINDAFQDDFIIGPIEEGVLDPDFDYNLGD